MRYKLSGRSGLRVSELALGTMTFGTDSGWGADKDESQAMFDAFAEAGGNFIDTANRYTNGTGEHFVGDFVREDREHFVVSTKYTLSRGGQDPNASGNHRKSLVESLEASLQRPGTDYVDLYWVHIWGPCTPIEEMMRALDDQVPLGKVLLERKLAIAAEVVAVAHDIGATPSQVALTWVRQRSATMIPIVGARKLSQLVDNVGSVEVVLTSERQARLDEASKIELGFPYDFIRGGRSSFMGPVSDQVDDHRNTVV